MRRTSSRPSALLRAFAFILITACVLLALPLSAAAEQTASVNGVELVIEADQDAYEADGAAHVTVTITNTNYYTVENISLKTIIPEGLMIDGVALLSQTISLAPGESVQIQNLTLIQKPEETTVEDTQAVTDPVEETDEETKKPADKDKNDKNAKDDEDEDRKFLFDLTPDDFAGDNIVHTITHLDVASYAIIGFLLLGLIILVALVARKIRNSVFSVYTLCFILCLAILMSSLPLGVIADEFIDEDTDSVTDTPVTDEPAADTNVEYVREPVDMAVDVSFTMGEERYTVVVTASWEIIRIVSTPQPEKTYTRGEWITLLAAHFGIAPKEINEQSICFFGDSVESEFGPLAEAFQTFGLLPAPDSEGYVDPEQDVPLFEADKIVTREYAAVTLARALGYEGTYELICADYDEITYKNEVSVVVMQNFFVLTDGYFFPANPLSDEDKLLIFAVLNSMEDIGPDAPTPDEPDPDDPTPDDPNPDETNPAETNPDDPTPDEPVIEEPNVVYQPNVLVITGDPIAGPRGNGSDAPAPYTATRNEDGTYTVILSKAYCAGLGNASAIRLPATSEYLGGLALMIASYTETEDSFVIEATVPESLGDIYYAMELEGSGIAALNRITSEDGVTVEYQPNGTMSDENGELAPFEYQNTIGSPIPGVLVSTLVDKEIGDTGLKVSGTVKFQMPAIYVRAGGHFNLFQGFRLDHCSIVVNSTAEIQAKLTYDFGIPESEFTANGTPTLGTGKILLHTIPVPIGSTGFCVDINVFLNLELEGSVGITFEVENRKGLEYRSGTLRKINDFSMSYEEISLNATAKLGLGVGMDLSLCSVFPLIGLDFHIGLAAEAEYIPHLDVEPVLHCADASLYLYATVEMNEDTIICSILQSQGIPLWECEIFTKDNSPFKRGIHFENGHVVDECTFGLGDMLGIIKDAETGAPIGGARVKIYSIATGEEVASVLSKTEPFPAEELYTGEFLVRKLPVGAYRMDVQASGYQMFSIVVNVMKDQRIICEAALMLLRDHITENGYVTGNIKNAMTGYGLTDTHYAVRKGWNITEGEPLFEGDNPNSSYYFELAPGNYTIEVSKEEHITSYINVVVQSGTTTNRDITVTPESGLGIGDSSFRVVLTWGEYPSDLDSHMYKYDSSGNQQFHTWYSDKNSYSGNGLEANLDVDDTTSYGPETTSVYQIDSGAIYHFYVHDYSNRYSSNSTAMSLSGVQVRLYSGEVLVAVFNLPENRGGTLWHVFSYNASTGEVFAVNELSFASRG